MTSGLGLNEHHDALVMNYLRFSRFERQQRLKAIREVFSDAKDTKLLDSTFTLEEIEEILNDIADVVTTEVESELISSSHTNVILLQQIFQHAQKWHLNLEADLAELENRELLDKVKSLEESEISSQSIDRPRLEVIQPQKKLAPLNEGGPMQLLHLQISELKSENDKIRSRVRELESQSIQLAEDKKKLEKSLEDEKSRPLENPKPSFSVAEAEVEDLNEAFKAVKTQLANELEVNAKTQMELESDLTATKHQLLDIQHQLTMTEKELEKKFSETGAYKNLKSMLAKKNQQIKELRQKLKQFDADNSDPE